MLSREHVGERAVVDRDRDRIASTAVGIVARFEAVTMWSLVGSDLARIRALAR